MDLIETLRTTAAIRNFHPDPVPDEVVHRILDNARFAPSGGNRHGWRVVVIKDPATRRTLRDLYLPTWYEYLAQRMVGLTPWAPVREDEVKALLEAPDELAVAAVVTLGRPVHQARKLTREPVDSFTTVDRVTGRAFAGT